jgi:hypothetical protein
MSFYLLFFLVLVSVGIIISYVYFMKEKKKNLSIVEQGICPKCHKESMELIDQRGGGCSGTKMLTFKCQSCHYVNTFNVDGGSCSSGRC